MRKWLALVVIGVLGGMNAPPARAGSLSLQYTIDPAPPASPGPPGGLYAYAFRLILDNADGRWVPGQGWGWVVFGDVPAGQTSPIGDFALTGLSPGNPFTGLGITGGGATGGGHNGPTLAPFSFAFPPQARLWVPTAVGQSIGWTGTAGSAVVDGLTFSTIEQVGDATKADFDRAVYVGVPEPAAGAALAAAAGLLLARRRRRRRRIAAAAVGALAALPAAGARAVPTFVNGGGSAGHLPGSPGGALFGSALVLQNGVPGLDPAFGPHRINFPSGAGGTTMANVGIGHVETANAVRLLFATGSGVSQSDPGDVQSPSVLEFQFGANWRIDGGSFGPPIATSFSVPVGMRVGAGGSAKFECEVHWSAVVGGVTVADARDPYVVSRTFGPGTLLTSFTAPARPYDFASIPGGGVNTVSIFGFVRFTVDNAESPSLVAFPTLADFPEFAGRPEMDIVPGVSVQEVPEPAAVGPAGVAGLLALGRRRRRRATFTGRG